MAIAGNPSLATSGRGIADRWTMLSGIAFAVLFVVLLIGSDSPDTDAPDAEWTAWFDDSGNRTLQCVGLFLMVLAAVAFVVFITGLVHRLRAAVTVHDGAARVAHGGGLVFAAAIALGGVAINQISGAIEFGDLPVPSADILRTAEQLGYGIVLIVGGWFAALTVAAASIAARGTTVLPNWLVTAGFVAAVILVFSVVFIPMVVLPLWVLAVAISVGRRSTHGDRAVRVNA